MNKYFIRLFSMIVLLIMSGRSAASASDQWDPSRTWSEMPWQIRYLLFVDTVAGRIESSSLAQRKNTVDRKTGNGQTYFLAEELLTQINTYATPTGRPIGATLLAFDKNGNVITNARELRGFTGKLSAIGNLVLMRRHAPDAKPYSLLNWSQGIPGNSSFGPSPCTYLDSLRYQDDWDSGEYPGDFGCREWTAQLFDSERPYIDVTTYTKRSNFIGRFVGWSRFEDGPKPIIGMNGKAWLCLHECPAGERPGLIADIKAWTRKHGYPMPVPPEYQPEYPNRNYQDDIDACMEE